VSIKAVSAYSGALRDLIKQFKYDGQARCASVLGRIVLSGLERGYDPDEWDLVVPNPTHPTRHVRHTEQILLGAADADVARRWAFDDPTSPCLVKTSPTPRSYSGDREARRAAAERLYAALDVARPELVAGRRLLVVDDVATTGAQLDQVAKKLSQHGASAVGALVLAVSARSGLHSDSVLKRGDQESTRAGRRDPGSDRPPADSASDIAAAMARLDRLAERGPALDGPGLEW
jgi:predicted amidophosphoribosyltransferase